MPDINDLGLSDEGAVDIDYNAPEPGAFPPQLKVGTYDFQFKLSNDPWDKIEVQGKTYLQVTYSATTTVEGDDKTLNFQRASAYKSEKMPNSMVGDLIRSLNMKAAPNASGKVDARVIADTLQQADAQGRHFRGDVAWRYYCKNCDHTVSTNASKKKVREGTQTPWPRDAQGNYPDSVACPKCGTKGYGREDIVRFRLPESGASQPKQTQSTTSAAAAASDVPFLG